MDGLALRRLSAAALAFLVWDHAGAARWLLVIDGVAQDVTAAVVAVGPVTPRQWDEPCEGCLEWRYPLPEGFDRRHVITVRACNDAGQCSADSNRLGPAVPGAPVVGGTVR